MKKKPANFLSLYIVLFIMILLVAWAVKMTTDIPEDTPFSYSDLLIKVDNGEVTKLEIIRDSDISNAGRVTAELSDGTKRTVKVLSMDSFMDFVHDRVLTRGVVMPVVTELPANTGMWISLIIQVVFIVGIVALFFFLMQQMQGGGGGGNRVMSFGKSRAKAVTDDKKKITFENVAGLKEERGELEEIVDFLKHPVKYVDIGARIPKGILLVGPPGTGKTLLAKAVSGEAGVPFFTISGSDFVEMFVGVGASRVRDLFEQAKKNSPCLVFIDEIDAVGRRRGAGLGGGHDEREQTLNQLLVEMDGFGANEGVIILAATNRPDILDPALLRPGRFDRKVVVNPPDAKGREDILVIHARGKQIAKDVDLGVIARSTPGFTGADLENLINESALLTARENKKEITMDELRRAYIKVGVGTEKKSRVITEKEKKITAYHEVGHAMIRELLPELEPVHIVSIIPTGMAGGYTMHLPEDDRMYALKSYMEKTLVAGLGGRAAEELVLGDISTGASNDIEKVTATARNMVMKYGMSPKLGPIQFGNDNDEVFIGRDLAHARNYSEQVASMIDAEIERIVSEAYSEALRLLGENIEMLHKCVALLIEKEKITGDEFRVILGKGTARVIGNTDVVNFLSEHESKDTMNIEDEMKEEDKAVIEPDSEKEPIKEKKKKDK